ncbi:hypothetical protein GCM10008937_24940 [Deinococcus depolymerans]|uniref:Uncharacterized protein n=2 Tax=Deinococcus depolymerans TaxID=392408 RepID=A0ABN1CDF7_9DEIO
MASAPAAAQSTPLSTRVEPRTITKAETKLQQEIIDSVQRRGGDLTKQHVHLLLAFSTSHYPQDPSAALAARELAWQLVKNMLVPGDHLSVAAWEMNVWKQTEPKVITAEDLNSEKPIRDLFPLTARPDTQPGHDTERAIAELAASVSNRASSTVMTLFVNNAASVAPRGQRTAGSDDPAYQSALSSFTRLASSAASGASVQLPYTVIQPSGNRDRLMDVVLVVPRAFSGATLANDRFSRTQRSPLGQEPPFPPPGPGPIPALLGLVALAALGWGAWKVLGSRRGQQLRIRPTEGDWEPEPSFSLEGINVGDEVAQIVGPNYEHGGARQLVVPRSVRDLPNVAVARLERTRQGIRIVPLAPFGLIVEGEAAPGGREVKAGQQVSARFEATHEFNSLYGAETVELPLVVTVD